MILQNNFLLLSIYDTYQHKRMSPIEFHCKMATSENRIYLILKVQKSNGDVFKLMESLLLLPVDFLIIFLRWSAMNMHDLSNINECGSTSKTNVVS